MVRADDFVAVGHICAGAKKQRTEVSQVLQKELWILRENLDVFRGDAIGLLQKFLGSIAKDDFTACLPSHARNIRCWQSTQKFFDLGGNFLR